jgi:two-component system, sensor histidine kinase and response regulator
MEAEAETIRALVVEDNPVNQKVVRRMLEDLGCTVVVANDGVEGVELAKGGHSIIFMDLSMPRMDGYEATRQIRALPGEVARTPIVALTAHATMEDRLACLSAGMDLWLPKPIVPDDLAGALSQFLSWKPGGPRLAETSVLDPAVVAQLRELAGPDDPEFVRSLVDEFREPAEVHVASAQRACVSHDLAGLRAAAGRLRKSSAPVGTIRLAALCDRIESSDDETLGHRGGEWTHELGQQLLRAVVELGSLGQG